MTRTTIKTHSAPQGLWGKTKRCLMKIVDLFAHFTKREWDLLRSKYSELEIREMLSRHIDIVIGQEAEKIESENESKKEIA